MKRFENSNNHRLGNSSEFFIKSNPDLKWNEHTDKPTYQFKVPIIKNIQEAESFSIDDIYKDSCKNIETIEDKNILTKTGPDSGPVALQLRTSSLQINKQQQTQNNKWLYPGFYQIHQN